MISPSYSLTATERVLPKMALDFTTAILDPRVTITRTGNTATVTNSSGVIAATNADFPRFDFDPTTLVCKGLLIEETRTNSLLNSLLDGTDLATQTVVVTAAARTLSFYGSGTVVLSGAHSATVVGNGAYPTRTTLTFTPSVGGLILTVTGTVQFAQLEAGAFATSFIPTAGATATRNADQASVTGTNFSDFFKAGAGSIVCEAIYNAKNINQYLFSIHSSDFLNRIDVLNSNGTNINTRIIAGGAAMANMALSSFNTGELYKLTTGFADTTQATSYNGATPITASGASTPSSLIALNLGVDFNKTAARFLNGCIRKFSYYPQRLTNAEIQAFSK